MFLKNNYMIWNVKEREDLNVLIKKWHKDRAKRRLARFLRWFMLFYLIALIGSILIGLDMAIASNGDKGFPLVVVPAFLLFFLLI